MIKNNAEKAPLRNSNSSNPTTYSTVYLRVQPYLTSIPSVLIPTSDESKSPESSASPTHLQFLLHLSSPSHSLTHTTTTQAVPSRWVDAFQQEDAEGKGEVLSWVEDVLVDVLRVGIEVIGQEYVGERMGWGNRLSDVSSRRSVTTQSEAEKGVTEETKVET
jgi:Family of unknown function (DUF5427)